MRLVHTSDWHITSGPYFEEAVRVLGAIVDVGIREKVDLWCVPGDFFGMTVPYRSTPEERAAFVELLTRMAEVAPVAGVYGNHEAALDLDVFPRLRTKHPILMPSRPETADLGPAQVYFLPYPLKRHFVVSEPDADLLGQKQTAEGLLRQILTGWRVGTSGGKPKKPCVLVAHVNIGGSATAGGEVMIGQEIELARHDLDELGVDYAALGHIHLQQQISARGYFCGSPYGQNFGETDEKVVLLVEAEAGKEPVVQRLPTLARRLVTKRVAWIEKAPGRWDWDWSGDVEGMAGAEVRFVATVPADRAATVPFDELADRATDEGRAHSVRVERRTIPVERVRSAAIATARSTDEKLRCYWTSLGTLAPTLEQQQRCLQRLAELESSPEVKGGTA